jgi:hypothetical protein
MPCGFLFTACSSARGRGGASQRTNEAATGMLTRIPQIQVRGEKTHAIYQLVRKVPVNANLLESEKAEIPIGA